MTALANDTVSLVADIGGTNTRVALARGTAILPDTIRRFANAERSGLGAVLDEYLASHGNVACAGACVAVAGPVHDGCATLTNLDWTIDRETVAMATKAKTVAILNDLQAQGHALDHIDPGNLRPVLSGDHGGTHAAKLVIGVGTGFNAAPVYNTETGRYVPPAEAGHGNLPIRSDDDLRLSRFVEATQGFSSVEDVLSGRGLSRIYAWVSSEAGTPRDLPPSAIMEALASSSAPLAQDAARAFVRMLGTVTGNLALQCLPFGGIYLVGGVARAFAPYLGQFGFGDAFRDKGRFAGFMDQFAVSVVEDDYAALTGCACHLDGLT
ncbi:glucokinase [Oceaniovalibus sp. ACAM 378]|uniref:glucokinase n=1 Tax=Oceaniovalibus sp. ACAM 378 TaxID=2599923 RepID=UPI0011D776E7|nr:glucokinase [Oceaniovalibus sp. ACAM 378]TYB91096.1 glucokinase [Oceaniovalibus sp. ACAM 378]